jgi:hypothetical protein
MKVVHMNCRAKGHQNCPIHTHTRHPKFTNYNTDHKAEGNVVKSYHHVKHDGDIFPTFTLFSDIAWLHLGKTGTLRTSGLHVTPRSAIKQCYGQCVVSYENNYDYWAVFKQ